MIPSKAKASRDPALTWDIPDIIDETLGEKRSEVREEFLELARRHAGAVLMQLLMMNDLGAVPQLHELILGLVETAVSLISPAALNSVPMIDPFECMTVHTLMCTGALEDSEVIDGTAFYGDVTHKRMRTYFSEPRFLLLSGNLEYDKEGEKLSSFDNLMEIEKQYLKECVDELLSVEPNVICIDGSVARYAQELLQTAGISIVSDIDKGVLSQMARCLGVTVHPVKSGPLQISYVGVAREFEVMSSDGQNEETMVSNAIVVVRGCQMQGMGSSIIFKGNNDVQLSKIRSITYSLLKVFYWNRLESAFLADQLISMAPDLDIGISDCVYHCKSIAERTISEVIKERGSNLILTSSPFVSTIDVRNGNMDTVSITVPIQQLRANISCRNPSKGILCESPHIHSMPFYTEGDLNLKQFLVAAAPTNRKCPHPHCGDGAGLHLRTFIHCESLVTLSSFILPSDKELPRGVWSWSRILGRGQESGNDNPQACRILLSDEASCISFSHLLYIIMDCKQFLFDKVNLMSDFVRYLGQGRTVICLHLTRIEPYRLVLPSAELSNPCSEGSLWLLDEIQSVLREIQEVFLDLERLLDNKCTADTSSADSCIAARDLRTSLVNYLEHLKDSCSQEKSTKAIFLLNRVRRIIFSATKMRTLLSLPLDSAQSSRDQSPARVATEDKMGNVQNQDSALTASEPHHRREKSHAKIYLAPKLMDAGEEDLRTIEDSKHLDIIPTGLVARFVCKLERELGNKNLDTKESPSSSNATANMDSFPIDERQTPPSVIKLNGVSNLPIFPGYSDSTILELEQDMKTFEDVISQNCSKLLTQGEQMLSSKNFDINRLYIQGARFIPDLDINGEINVAIFDNEISSVISYFLGTTQYQDYISKATEKCIVDAGRDITEVELAEEEAILENPSTQSDCLMIADDPTLPRPIKLRLTAYFAPQFGALRRMVLHGDEEAFIASMSRCKPWNPESGKSGLQFFKTRDDAFVVKELNSAEFRGILNFAPDYFRYLAKSFKKNGTCLAKILGVFSISIEGTGGHDSHKTQYDVIVMENLFARRNFQTILDFKGTENNSVGDESFLIAEHEWHQLYQRIERDCNFLSAVLGVMDYSLVLGVDKVNHDIFVGVIDYLRTYTLDKQLETIVKGATTGKSPTIVAPKAYSTRFLKAVEQFFTVVPCWNDEKQIYATDKDELKYMN